MASASSSSLRLLTTGHNAFWTSRYLSSSGHVLQQTWPKHHDASSECPDLSKDKMTFINMRFCPFAQRTHLVLEAKGIEYEMVNVNLIQKPGWFLKMNPIGKVPVIKFGDQILYESLPINNYLDQVHPGPRLSPEDPLDQAKDDMLLEHCVNQPMGYLFKIFYGRYEEGQLPEVIEKLHKKLDLSEKILSLRKTKFMSSNDKPMMVDYNCWPFYERMEALQAIYPDHPGGFLPASRFPRLDAWTEAMREDKAVMATYLEPELHARYNRSFRRKEHDFDLKKY